VEVHLWVLDTRMGARERKARPTRTFPERLPAENGHRGPVGHDAELPAPPRPRPRRKMVKRVNFRPNVPAVPFAIASVAHGRKTSKRNKRAPMQLKSVQTCPESL
jgi:hypothetical protein